MRNIAGNEYFHQTIFFPILNDDSNCPNIILSSSLLKILPSGAVGWKDVVKNVGFLILKKWDISMTVYRKNMVYFFR